MKKIIISTIFCFIALIISAQTTDKNIFVKESKYNFEETTSRLLQKLEEIQLPVFANFNHQQNAQEVGLTMEKSNVIVFGNPKAGTLLMQENPQIALDLPMKIAVIEDKNQKVQLIFIKPDTFIKKYKIKNKTIIQKMQSILENLVFFAGN